MKRIKIIRIIISIVLVLLALSFIVPSIMALKRDKKARKTCSQELTGMIVDVEEYEVLDIHGYGILSYCPIIGYTADEEFYAVKYNYITRENNFEIGKELKILINPAAPSMVYIPEYNSIILCYISLAGSLLVLILSYVISKPYIDEAKSKFKLKNN